MTNFRSFNAILFFKILIAFSNISIPFEWLNLPTNKIKFFVIPYFSLKLFVEGIKVSRFIPLLIISILDSFVNFLKIFFSYSFGTVILVAWLIINLTSGNCIL